MFTMIQRLSGKRIKDRARKHPWCRNCDNRRRLARSQPSKSNYSSRFHIAKYVSNGVMGILFSRLFCSHCFQKTVRDLQRIRSTLLNISRLLCSPNFIYLNKPNLPPILSSKTNRYARVVPRSEIKSCAFTRDPFVQPEPFRNDDSAFSVHK